MPKPKKVALSQRLARNMRDYRLRRKLTQEEAASKADIDYKRWQAIEAARANVTLKTLERIAEVLRVDPQTLLKG